MTGYKSTRYLAAEKNGIYEIGSTGSITICLEAGLQRSVSCSLRINSCDLDSDLERRKVSPFDFERRNSIYLCYLICFSPRQGGETSLSRSSASLSIIVCT